MFLVGVSKKRSYIIDIPLDRALGNSEFQRYLLLVYYFTCIEHRVYREYSVIFGFFQPYHHTFKIFNLIIVERMDRFCHCKKYFK